MQKTKDEVQNSSKSSWSLIGAVVITITLLRILALYFDQTDLFVDETQYWLWGQEFDFGYYSKPPLIGWVLRLFDEIALSHSPFWVRLPAPIFHGITALMIAALTKDILPNHPKAGAIAAIAYLTLPIVSFGSFLISTDTILAPFFLAGIWLYWRATRSHNLILIACSGLCFGIAFLAKYAAIYGILGIVLAQIFTPNNRLNYKEIILLFLVFTIIISPNIFWNISHDLTTVSHTLDNVGWVKAETDGPKFSIISALEFIGSQIGAFGPLLFLGLIGAIFNAKANPGKILIWFTVPVLLIVTAQAFLDKAYANWAATGLMAGLPLTIIWLLHSESRKLLKLAIGLNSLLCLIIPIISIFPSLITLPNGQSPAYRYLGRAEMSSLLIAEAQKQQKVLVSDNRDLLADLFYRVRDHNLEVFSNRPDGYVRHYYQQKHALPEGFAAPVVFATRRKTLICDGSEQTPYSSITPKTGAYKDKTIFLYNIAGNCL